MIVSETPHRLNSRWLQACVLLCAIVMLRAMMDRRVRMLNERLAERGLAPL